jgi:TPR repeat protein
MYRDGVGTEINDPLASMYFYNAFKLFDQKAEEDLQASGKYRYRQGMMYMKGDGLPVDYGKAVEYFSEADRQGNLQAYYQIAQIYLKGGEGVERDVDLAVSFLKDAAAKNRPESCYTLGKMYLEGRDIEKDERFAMWLFESAVQKGHSKAAYELAKLYRAKNDPEAEKLFNQSFDKQRGKANEYYATWTDEYKEARNYLFGLNDVEKNFELALKFMNAQADIGNAYAIYDLV